MQTKYIIDGLHKHAEQDVWETGCISEGGSYTFVDVKLSANTIEGVIRKARDFVGVGEDATELNACEEPGRVDFAVTENEEGHELTDAQVVEWKAGRRKAWYCVYTGYVERETLETIAIPE